MGGPPIFLIAPPPLGGILDPPLSWSVGGLGNFGGSDRKASAKSWSYHTDTWRYHNADVKQYRRKPYIRAQRTSEIWLIRSAHLLSYVKSNFRVRLSRKRFVISLPSVVKAHICVSNGHLFRTERYFGICTISLSQLFLYVKSSFKGLRYKHFFKFSPSSQSKSAHLYCAFVLYICIVRKELLLYMG